MWEAEISKASKKYLVPSSLIRAIIQTESSYNPKAERYEPALNDTSYGLMQVLTKTAEWLEGRKVSKAELLNPQDNILIGTHYLRYQLDRYKGDVNKAVAAYNAGTARATESGTKFINQVYVDKVLSAMDGTGTLLTVVGAAIAIFLFLKSR